jgi:hypothetical protein
MNIKLENPEPKLITAAAILVNTASLSLIFNVTFFICIVFNIPLRWAFIANAIVGLTSIFRVYSTIKFDRATAAQLLSIAQLVATVRGIHVDEVIAGIKQTQNFGIANHHVAKLIGDDKDPCWQKLQQLAIALHAGSANDLAKSEVRAEC